MVVRFVDGCNDHRTNRYTCFGMDSNLFFRNNMDLFRWIYASAHGGNHELSGIPNCPDCGELMICYEPRLEYRCIDCNSYYIREWAIIRDRGERARRRRKG